MDRLYFDTDLILFLFLFFLFFQINLKYWLFVLFSCLIISSNGLFTSENVIFQKANEIFTNDAHWYVTFVHDLKLYQGLINKISHDINSTNEIV